MKKLGQMVSMELDDEEKMDFSSPIAIPSKPDYPYGLRICLTEKELKKLKVDPSEAAIGGMVHLKALARITSISQNEDSNGENCRIELQIENLDVEAEEG